MSKHYIVHFNYVQFIVSFFSRNLVALSWWISLYYITTLYIRVFGTEWSPVLGSETPA